jgi:hypothetical protein
VKSQEETQVLFVWHGISFVNLMTTNIAISLTSPFFCNPHIAVALMIITKEIGCLL